LNIIVGSGGVTERGRFDISGGGVTERGRFDISGDVWVKDVLNMKDRILILNAV
jgi:hypothetical protein